MKKIYPILFLFATLSACGSGGDGNVIQSPLQVTVDSENDRLFIMEEDAEFLAFTASNQDNFGNQPIVNEDRLEDIWDVLPKTATHMAVIADGSVSRIFIAGSQPNDDGEQVQNLLRVLEFDGDTLSEADFSPIVVADEDAGTDDSSDVIGGLTVDAAHSRLYVTNITRETLHAFSTVDGTKELADFAIAGTPNQMSLVGNRLFIANSSTEDAEQLITVINTDDATATTIDLDLPTDDISAAQTDAGLVLLAKVSDANRVLILNVDTATFADAAGIAAGDDSEEDGELNSDTQLTASVGTLAAASLANGEVWGIIGQNDGDFIFIRVSETLDSFTTLLDETSTSIYTDSDILVDGDGNGLIFFLTAAGTGDLIFNDVGDDSVDALF